MEKRFLNILIVVLISGIFFTGCASVGFYDREISMKESCVLEFKWPFKGYEQHLIMRGGNSEKNKTDSYGQYKEIFGGEMGIQNIVIPAGIYYLGFSNTLHDIISQKVTSRTITTIYEVKNYSYNSDIIEFEIGKRYRMELSEVDKKINITELKGSGISSSGVMVKAKSAPTMSALSWRYSNGFTIAEAGPQLGFYIISDTIFMHITGEATIGLGFFGGDNNGIGFPYRVGGSLTTFFGKSRFGFGLGGGVTGQTIMLLGDEGNEMFPKIQVPYIQAKALFRPRKGFYDAFGLYLDYYPTVTPVKFGSFGFGLAMQFQ